MKAGIKTTPRPPHLLPAQRPVATGELVRVDDLPAYRARHGLRIVRCDWPAHSPYPLLRVIVAPSPTERD